jgi:hypothetical protein
MPPASMAMPPYCAPLRPAFESGLWLEPAAREQVRGGEFAQPTPRSSALAKPPSAGSSDRFMARLAAA